MRNVWPSIILTAALAAGCAPSRTRPDLMPVVTPPPAAPAQTQDNPGSLFGQGQADNLFSDNRARRVGDVVAVLVNDVSKGEHKADTTASRQSTMNFQVNSFLGHSKLPYGVPTLGLGTPVNPSVAAIDTSSTNDHTATGDTKRESHLSASVAARVVQVLPNGLMQIEGARELRINDETQILVVKGLVRPQDIDADNSIGTDKLADATIEYYGEGVLADKQKPGWLARILDNVWPF
ncbi:Flagellar L-ring protein [Desulfovibrio sp. X2]|uniref:flagellar basal body L-ring protein FlgH n=1 Tax=Desulfovibrio sp. X2 TaxID=941449 RepID=UPI000358B4B9|nr:flagellar basal body L-ring protein FlgH [Desulfovibrio sp. X2]EPR41703.1 Flagellar L-ring protein [Desulfovibrio sp. X2]